MSLRGVGRRGRPRTVVDHYGSQKSVSPKRTCKYEVGIWVMRGHAFQQARQGYMRHLRVAVVQTRSKTFANPSRICATLVENFRECVANLVCVCKIVANICQTTQQKKQTQQSHFQVSQILMVYWVAYRILVNDTDTYEKIRDSIEKTVRKQKN